MNKQFLWHYDYWTHIVIEVLVETNWNGCVMRRVEIGRIDRSTQWFEDNNCYFDIEDWL